MEFAFEVEGARRPAVEAPAQQPMRPEKLRRNPDAEQRKVRRQQARQRKTAEFENRGHWQIIGLGGKLDGRRFISSGDAAAAANKTFGLGNWTLQWVERVEARQRRTARGYRCPQCKSPNIETAYDPAFPTASDTARCTDCGWEGPADDLGGGGGLSPGWWKDDEVTASKTALAMVTCPECGGGGILQGAEGEFAEGGVCEYCGGSGRVPDNQMEPEKYPSTYDDDHRFVSEGTMRKQAQRCPNCGSDEVAFEDNDDSDLAVASESWARCPDCGWVGSEDDVIENTAKRGSAMNREAQILRAMAKASLPEQRALALELDALRRGQAHRVQAARDVDLADSHIRDCLTPVLTHSMHTAATDWIGEVPDEDGADEADGTMVNAMRTAATMWFRKTSSDVKADREEFAEQAMGMARREAGRYGERAAIARRAYLDHVGHLHTAESGSDLTADPSGIGQSGLPDGVPLSGHDETFDEDFWADVDAEVSSDRAPVVQENKQGRRASLSDDYEHYCPGKKGDHQPFATDSDEEWAAHLRTHKKSSKTAGEVPPQFKEQTEKVKDPDKESPPGFPDGDDDDDDDDSDDDSDKDSDSKDDKDSDDDSDDKPPWLKDKDKKESRRTAADQGSIYCNKCKGQGMIRAGGVVRNCPTCKGSGLKKRPKKQMEDIFGEPYMAARTATSQQCPICGAHQPMGTQEQRAMARSHYEDHVTMGQSPRRAMKLAEAVDYDEGLTDDESAELDSLRTSQPGFSAAFRYADLTPWDTGQPDQEDDNVEDWDDLADSTGDSQDWSPFPGVSGRRRQAGMTEKQICAECDDDIEKDDSGSWKHKSGDKDHAVYPMTQMVFKNDRFTSTRRTAADDPKPWEGGDKPWHSEEGYKVYQEAQDMIAKGEPEEKVNAWAHQYWAMGGGEPIKMSYHEWSLRNKAFEKLHWMGNRRTASDPIADESGQGRSGLDDVEVGDEDDRPMWPWELPDGDPETGKDAADVGSVPTPGGEKGYPKASRRVEAWKPGESTSGPAPRSCSVCGDSIERDPSGEDPQTWHHDNGEKHDHEATPGGGKSKQSAFRAKVQANLGRL